MKATNVTYICTYDFAGYKFTVELTKEELNEEANKYGMPKPELSSAKEIINCLGWSCAGVTH